MSQPLLVLGRGGGNDLYQAATGFQDDGVAYQLRGRSDRVAPAGIDGECIFPSVFLAIEHTMAVDLVVVPYLDDVALDPITFSLTAKTERTLERFEIGLSVTIEDGLGVDRGKCYPRGTWFELEVYDDGLATGWVSIEEARIEFEVVRESLAAVNT